MKRILVIASVICAFLIVSTNAQAQLLRFGVKAGATFNKFNLGDGLDNFKNDSYTGWQAGIMARIKVPLTGLAIQPEALYSVVGNDDLKFGYLQIPINLQFGFDLLVARIYAQAGPYFGYAVKLPNDDGWDEKAKDVFKKQDWGIGVGLGADLFNRLNVALKYDFGLQNVSDIGDVDLKNRTLNLSVGYFFGGTSGKN